MSSQVELNYSWFKANLASLIKQHRGAHALIHDRAISGYYPSSLEAVTAGLTKFGEGNFSVEVIDDRVEDLGFYSHVGSALQA
ncbi:MAG: hypothetical protein R3E14_07005 [Erythrobacter sp.]